MRQGFDCEVAAGLLQSGRTVAQAANAAAVIAGVGYWYVHSGATAWILALSLLSWLFECWFAVRVAIDYSLIRLLESNGEEGGSWLDSMLFTWKLGKRREARSLADRTLGAVRLWRLQGTALALQLLALGAAVVIRAWSD